MLPDTVIALLEDAQTARALAMTCVNDDVSSRIAYFQRAADLFEQAGMRCESIARQAYGQAHDKHQGNTADASTAYGIAAEYFQLSCNAYHEAYDTLSAVREMFKRDSALPVGIIVRRLMVAQRQYRAGHALSSCGTEHVALLTGVMRANLRDLL